MLGQIIGGIVGAHILSSIKAAFVRKLLIFMLLLTSFKLLSRGLEGLFNISIPLIYTKQNGDFSLPRRTHKNMNW